jgi:hypothetical protein
LTVVGAGLVAICNECVAMRDVYLGGASLTSRHIPRPKDLQTERLIAQLRGVEATVRGKRAQFQWVVDELRRREVGWADIGLALAISRQAWDQFS